MKKRIFSVFLAVVLVVSMLAGCSAKTTDTNIIETNSELKYFKFPKTDWGMTPQEVMKAWNLTFDDVTIEPESGVENMSLAINMTTSKDIKIIGETVTNVTFKFGYLLVSGAGKGKLGLTMVKADYDYASLDKVMEASKKALGDKFAATIINSSEGNFGTLPTKTRENITAVLSNFGENNHIGDNPEMNWLSTYEVHQGKEEPYKVNVIYNGYVAALANADYTEFNAAMADFKTKHGITD